MKTFVMSATVITLASVITVVDANSSVALQEAQQLISQGNSEGAYKLLLPLENELAGNKDFDYALGVAALEIGNINQAIFSLERAVSSNPQFGGAYMDLGRAYYQANDFHHAKHAFETVQTLSPPANLRKLTENYLQAINSKLTPNQINTLVSIELATGYDTNINNGSYHDSIYTPAITLVLSDNARALSDKTMSEQLSAVVIYSANSRNKWILGGTGIANQYENYTAYQTMTSIAYAQYSYTTAIHQVNMNLSRHQSYVDYKLNNYGINVGAEYRFFVDKNLSLGTVSGISAIRHADIYKIRDINRYRVGTTASYQAQAIRPILFNTGLFLSHDDAIVEYSVFENDSLSLQIDSQIAITPKTAMSAGFQLAIHDYGTSSFAIDRRDHLANAKVSLSARINKSWEVTPNAGYTVSRSNLDLYDFNKVYAALAVKRTLL